MFIDPVINPSPRAPAERNVCDDEYSGSALHKNEVYAAHSVIRTGSGSDRVNLRKGFIYFSLWTRSLPLPVLIWTKITTDPNNRETVHSIFGVSKINSLIP
jgi:hypothetical protein